MSFTTSKTHMEEAAALLLRDATGEAGGLLARCSAGLRALASQAELYDEQIVTMREFIPHFEEELLQLRENTPSSRHAVGELPGVWDAAFALLEDIVVFMREKVLRTGFAEAMESERSTLRYFENCGHWKAGDGTLVSEAYYVTLPATILHEMLARLKGVETERFAEELPPVGSGPGKERGI